MESKFRILRIIGTLWKVFAWIELVVGVVVSLGLLLFGLLGSGGALFQLFGQESSGIMGAFGLVSSVVGFVIVLVTSVVYFLILYAVGELICLLLAIEENTRRTAQWIQGSADTDDEPATAAPTPSP